jgi:hypothetical protein
VRCDGLIWRARRAWSWSPGWCSYGRRTRWSSDAAGLACSADGRKLKDDTIDPRERLVHRFLQFTNEYPWGWAAGHMDEWSLQLTAEQDLAPSTIRSYQCSLRLFTEFLIDGRYGWVVACEQTFGLGNHPVAIAYEWNTIAHLNDYEGNPRPGRSLGPSCSGSWTTPMSCSPEQVPRPPSRRCCD